MSWRRRLQDARQRRQDILAICGRTAGGPCGTGYQRCPGRQPGPRQAVASGKAMARKVLSIQRAAGLNQKLVERSARSVVNDQEPRHQSPGHSAWVAGYAAEVRERVPGILPEPERRPEWFEVNPHSPNRDDVELEA